MFSVFLELVKRVGIFVIIGQTILNFGISKNYEKYMKLILSFMVTAQVVFAFGSYFHKEEKISWKMFSKEYYEQWEENRKEIEAEFVNRQLQLTENLEERFQKTKEMGVQREKENGKRIEIEKIIIQK